MKLRTLFSVASTGAIVAASLAPSLAAAATPRPSMSGAVIPLLRIGATGTFSSLDPAMLYNVIETSTPMEGLLALGPNSQLGPELATSVSRPSPTVYVFHLRQGVKFWDGDEMTSADVVTSLEHYEQPAYSTASSYVDVASIKADGPNTVVITLKTPNAGFEATLAWQGDIFEKKFYDAHKTTMGHPGTLIEGTGPWEVTSFDPTTSEELSANPNWWGGKVNIAHISIKFFATETSMALAFRAGDIDVAFPAGATAFAATSGAKLTSVPANSVAFFGMNTKLAPWSDVHVRRAVAYALDRAELITADANPGVPVSTLIPPDQLLTLGSGAQVKSLLAARPSYPYNIAKAKAELAESAYPQGFSAYSDTTSVIGGLPEVTQAIAGMLQKIGINLKVRLVNENIWENEVDGATKSPDTYTTFNLPSPDPSTYPSFMLGSANIGNGGWNWANYDPPEVDTLLKQGIESQSPSARLAIYAKLLKVLATDVPYVPLFIADYNMALSTRFSYPGFNRNYGRTAWELHVTLK